jgi:Spy/CpxP family protein refolding chaperone
MRRMTALAFALMSLLSIAAAACSEAPSDVYDNDIHSGYPGPGTKSNNRDG